MKKAKGIVFVLAACIIACGVLSLFSWGVAKIYWAQPHLDMLAIDMEKYEDSLSDANAEHSSTTDMVRRCNMEATAVPETCEDYLDACNEIIVRFFEEVYDVDVSQKMAQLQVMRAVYPGEIAESVGGSFFGGVPDLAGKVFVNSTILTGFIDETVQYGYPSVCETEHFYAKMLRTVYIHEVIHYLGFSNDAIFDHSIEAFTEYLNEKIMTYSGIEYESITGYGQIKNVASLIIEADTQLVRKVLEEESFSIGEHFNEILGADLADEFDSLAFLLQKNGSAYHSDISFWLQYIAYEYVKAASDDIDQCLEAAYPGIVPLFELRWLLQT